MADLYRSFEEFVKAHELIHTNEKVVIGVSGGADSVCLLLLLSEHKKHCDMELTAVHINHMIRVEEADRDEDFVLDLCRKLEVPCILKRIDVPGQAKAFHESEEEAGRRVRYDVFCEIARKQNAVIAVAHHRDDNAETVLLNVVRGSGSRGLSGMQPKSEMNGCTVIRPLLKISRAEIEEYLNERGVTYCTDSTNADDGYARNAVRLNVLPKLSEINSRAAEHITKAAEQLSEIEAYLEEETEIEYAQIVSLRESVSVHEDGIKLSIHIPSLTALHPVIAKRVILKAIAAAAERAKDITSAHVAEVLQLAELQSGRKVSLPYGLLARRQYDEILIYAKEEEEKGLRQNDPSQADAAVKLPLVFASISKEDVKNGYATELADGRRIEFSLKAVDDSNRTELTQKNVYTKCFDYDTIKGTINVGEKVQGDRIFLRNGMKTVKKYFIDEKIPADERDKVLIVKDEESVMWIVGYRISEKHKITEQTKTALVVKLTDGGKHEHWH